MWGRLNVSPGAIDTSLGLRMYRVRVSFLRVLDSRSACALGLRPLESLNQRARVLATSHRENERATLVGERTFGKGVIQTVEPLTSGGGVAVTVARWVDQTEVYRSKGDVTSNLDGMTLRGCTFMTWHSAEN